MLEVQIVDARGGDFVAAVAASHQTGKLIDPRDQLAAEQTAIAVDMAVATEDTTALSQNLLRVSLPFLPFYQYAPFHILFFVSLYVRKRLIKVCNDIVHILDAD